MKINQEIFERIKKGLSYSGFLDNTKIKLLTTDPNNLSEQEKQNHTLLRLNYQRSIRIEDNFAVPENLVELIRTISNEQIWMIITEDWCGDSAQNLPFIIKIAQANPKIHIKILLRDSNPDIIDLYLTNGTRSIPVLIAFDFEGNEIFRWGPRPKVAQEYVMECIKQGLSKDEYIEKLHRWYSNDKG
jgi:hypothetical protein